jgi:hypothetical protein
MIQRIQSVWLFLATCSLFALLLFPYIHILDMDGTTRSVRVTGVYENLNGQVVQTEAFLALTVVTIIVALIPFIIIFFYRNRKLQITLSYVTILLIIGLSFWTAQVAKAQAGNISLGLENYGLGVALPPIAILFMILALKGIRKDEKLIRSADRLR